MERGSDKHGARVDEQLEHETAALTHGAPDEGRTEGRTQEGLVADEPTTGHRPELDEPLSNGLTETDVELRAQVAAAVAPAQFPATSEVLRETARAEHAAADVLALLDGLPDGRTYEVVQEIWEDSGGPVEGGHA
jgi:hypothetical protein